MTPRYRHSRLIDAFLLSYLLFLAPDILADISYDSSAAINYAINGITSSNAANPNDLTGLAVLGSFQQLTDAYNSYGVTSGDGFYTANNPDISPQPVATGFNNAFSVSGESAAYGTVRTLQTGQFSLAFINSGSNSFTIDVTLSYLLNAVTSGLYANSSIQLDYWDTANNIIDNQDAVLAGTLAGFGYDNESKSGSYNLVFTLAPGATDSFVAQAVITSTLDSTSVSSVPLPTAAWGFLGAVLGILGFKRSKCGKV